MVLTWASIQYPGITMKDIALNAGWVNEKGQPLKQKVQRLLNTLGRKSWPRSTARSG